MVLMEKVLPRSQVPLADFVRILAARVMDFFLKKGCQIEMIYKKIKIELLL